MRFPSVGGLHDPQKNSEKKIGSLLDDLLSTQKNITDIEENIASLKQKIMTTPGGVEKELLQKKLVNARIDLVEAQTAEQFLEEEHLTTLTEKPTEENALLAEN